MTEADRRPARIGWSALCFVLLAGLAVLLKADPGAFAFDTTLGRWPESLTVHHHDVRVFWDAVALMFTTLPEAVATVVVVVALWFKGHRRAATWTLAVMVTAGVGVVGSSRWSGATDRCSRSGAGALQLLVPLRARDRDRRSGRRDDRAQHDAGAPRGVRRLLRAVALALVVLVGADRVFLGVHYTSDVLAGYLLGAGITLAWLAVYDPIPRVDRAGQPAAARRRALRAQAGRGVLNPSKIDDAGQFRAMVEALAARRRASSRCLVRDDRRRHRLRHGPRGGRQRADLVVAIGGDGTVRAVCEELAGTGIPVGIVPAGTGNLLARNLGIPLYLRARRVDVALNGQDRAIDLVEVTGDKMEDTTSW